MKRLLKQKLKEQLQGTSQTARNKGSRTVGLGYRDLYREMAWTRMELFIENTRNAQKSE